MNIYSPPPSCWTASPTPLQAACTSSSPTTIAGIGHNGIRVIFLYVPLVVFAVMFVILLFYKLDKEYDGIVKELGERK